MRIVVMILAVLMILGGLTSARYYTLYNQSQEMYNLSQKVVILKEKQVLSYSDIWREQCKLTKLCDDLLKEQCRLTKEYQEDYEYAVRYNLEEIGKTLDFVSHEFSILLLILEHPDSITEEVVPLFKEKWLKEFKRIQSWKQQVEGTK